MEFMMPYLFPVLLLPLSLFLIFFIRKNSSGHLKNLPPGSEGWPILGENVELVLVGAEQLVRDRMQKYSAEIFKTSLLGERMAVLCGPEGNKFVFSNEDKLFTRWPPASLRKVMFPDLDASRSQETVATFHNFQYDALKPESLKKYVHVIDSLAREHFLHGGWNPNSVVRVHPSIKKYTLELVCRIFMDVVDPDRIGKLLEPLSRMTDGLISVPVNLPGTAFNRAIRGSRVVRGELLGIIKDRRKELMTMTENKADDNLLSKMVLATPTDQDGKIVNVILGLLVNAHYEASSAVSIVINFLAQLPHIYHQVLEEQMEIAKSKGPDELLTLEDVGKMKYTWNVARECFRQVPPGHGALREAKAEFTYLGFTIPKGWKIYWTPHSTHNNPKYFPEPEKFDPSRFEGSGPAPYTYIPFGGGPKVCAGIFYTRLVILVFIHSLVTRFRFDKVIPNEKMLFNRMAPAPAHGLPLHLYPHQN